MRMVLLGQLCARAGATDAAPAAAKNVRIMRRRSIGMQASCVRALDETGQVPVGRWLAVRVRWRTIHFD
jgi:hypothetical protein